MQSGLQACKQEKFQLCSITASQPFDKYFARIDWSCCKYSTRNSLVVASIADLVSWCFAFTCLVCLFFQVRDSPWLQRQPNWNVLTLCCVQYSASSVGSAGERACWCDLHSQHFRRSREPFDTEWLATVSSRRFCASGEKQRSGCTN